jgi:hypothetical protein
MQLIDETRAVLDALMNPTHRDLIELANVPGVGADLALAHIELMREHGEPVPTSLNALERVLTSRK